VPVSLKTRLPAPENQAMDFRPFPEQFGKRRCLLRLISKLGKCQIQWIARKGVAVVWIQPPPDSKHEIKPLFYVVTEGKGAIVIVQPNLLADFSERQKSPLNLIYFSKLALHSAPPALPNFSLQP
jgi:hypothetical protein